MTGVISSPTPRQPASDTQQQAIINAVARRQYGRWAAQYRGANLWAAVQRDVGGSQPAAPAPAPAQSSRQSSAAECLTTLYQMLQDGVLTDEEFTRLKEAVLAQ